MGELFPVISIPASKQYGCGTCLAALYRSVRWIVVGISYSFAVDCRAQYRVTVRYVAGIVLAKLGANVTATDLPTNLQLLRENH